MEILERKVIQNIYNYKTIPICAKFLVYLIYKTMDAAVRHLEGVKAFVYFLYDSLHSVTIMVCCSGLMCACTEFVSIHTYHESSAFEYDY